MTTTTPASQGSQAEPTEGNLLRTRDRLALALDVSDVSVALQLLLPLRSWFGVGKVGLQLFTAAGPAAVQAVAGEGFSVFLDLKLHDTPTPSAGPPSGH